MWKRLIISLFIIIAVLMGSAIALDRWISWKTAPYVYDELQELPHRQSAWCSAPPSITAPG